MRISNWLKNKIAVLSIAFSNVEKNVFSQKKDSIVEDTTHTQRHLQGTLADALLRGEMNQEVKNLRWRIYKILKASKNVSLIFDKNDENGDNWYKTKKIEQSRLLDKVMLDSYDDYPLEMVVINDEIKLSNLEAISEHFKGYDEPIKNTDENGEVLSATHGEISANEFFIGNKGEKLIQINRNLFPKFYIERYTKRVNIRKINKKERLLEFYIGKYPDEYDRTNYLFIKEINNLIKNGPERINFIELNNVEFITNNTLGVEDFLYYNYKIKSFNKVIEFDGNYVIKFIGEVIVDGEDILSKYIEPEIEQNYLDRKIKI